MRNRFAHVIHRLMARDPRLILLLADVGEYMFRDTFSTYGDRAYNLGVSEQAIVDMACGLSRVGYIPIIYGIAPFVVERVYEQIKLACLNDAKFILASVGASYDYGREGPTHHCPADVALLYQIPDMNIIVPGTASEMEALLIEAVDQQVLPCYIRLSETSNDESCLVHLGVPLDVVVGPSITNPVPVIAVGPALKFVIGSGASRIFYVTSLRPLDVGAFSGLIRPLVVEPYYSLLPGIIAGQVYGPICSVSVQRKSPGFVSDREGYDYWNGLYAAGIKEVLEKLLEDNRA